MAARLDSLVVVAVSVVLAVLVAMSGRAEGQSCVTALLVCQPYLNSTPDPSSPCCEALRSEVTTDLPCVCGLFSPAVRQSYNVTTEQAYAFATACGVSNLNACATLPPSKSPSPPSSVPPPATGDAGRARWIGAHGLISLVVFWRTMMP